MVKGWIDFFTCFTRRAVHLELVQNLIAESFLRVLRRFVTRCGYPELVLSDNVETRSPHENETVLLNESDIPHGMWKLARIKAIKRGWDGKISTVTIQMSNGKLLDRPINELYPLKVDDSECLENQSHTSSSSHSKRHCKWASDIPFNIPQKWNSENASEQNFTSMKVGGLYTDLCEDTCNRMQ
ncbi:unnamed protein product [Onchocerca ochengi]|uniref:DUF5641 domain-containing protein n=1 Tax=Onchocerca ochengi TaxID=42157 RepID=A0A182E3Y8_ONCOC|nr:unnamed protein product [Onchocerca ochengi]